MWVKSDDGVELENVSVRMTGDQEGQRTIEKDVDVMAEAESVDAGKA